MQQETKKFEEKMGDVHAMAGRKCMDSASLNKIKQTDEITDECVIELERNKECESMLDQADCWMGRRNKTFRMMMD